MGIRIWHAGTKGLYVEREGGDPVKLANQIDAMDELLVACKDAKLALMIADAPMPDGLLAAIAKFER